MKEFIEGKQAYKQDKQLEDNPYPILYDEKHIKWVEDFLNAEALDNKEYIGLGSSNTNHF